MVLYQQIILHASIVVIHRVHYQVGKKSTAAFVIRSSLRVCVLHSSTQRTLCVAVYCGACVRRRPRCTHPSLRCLFPCLCDESPVLDMTQEMLRAFQVSRGEGSCVWTLVWMTTPAPRQVSEQASLQSLEWASVICVSFPSAVCSIHSNIRLPVLTVVMVRPCLLFKSTGTLCSQTLNHSGLSERD